MGMFFLALLFVVVIPLAEGWLLALVLRELHIRHPLPLGGTIGVRQTAAPNAHTAEGAHTAEPHTTEAHTAAEGETPPKDAEGTSLIDAENAELLAALTGMMDGTFPSAEPANEDESQEIPHEKTSVFDGTANIPENLPISNILEAMTAETSTAIPDDFERRIEESAQPDDEVLSALRAFGDDMDHEALQALAEALPGTKIDFSQEAEPEESSAVSPMAKELLGEQFDFDALERQADQLKQSSQPPVLDVLEDESGVVQVSSPFMSATSQLAGFATPQTVLPAFSSDWIQESGITSELIEGDPSQFCYTEESRPMFVRKKKNADA